MQSKTGTVSSIKILKMSERPLIFFKLNETSCLIASHSLKFLAEVDEGMKLAVCGEYNSRKQFIIKRYSVIGMTKIMIEFEESKLPRKKVIS
ncbi:hypothetical protein NRIC_37960 [Enterococcus florum]|uniref:Uncharacterized protein n=1 Tax=Enterococcus florum TaxID=2480627 RepID=A0A4P5PCE6_9ENTE|nr:hypothetical protein [Enterococcus florum]GCF95905.1 hypothetical protein NRIC_37960 [Enterococcus florum]